MAIPLVKSLRDSVDINQTVLPYIPQLFELPSQVLQTTTSPQALKGLYVSTNPLITALAISLFLAPVFLVVSEINRNYSQVDRCWSLLPTLYNAHFALYAHMAELPSQRLDLLLALSTLWSCRLTYNYWRKGGYTVGSEDYRWEVLKDYMGPVLFSIFNVIFISLAQSVLLLSVTLPTYAMLVASTVNKDSLSTVDLGVAGALVSLIFAAAIADQQQWNYQSAKSEYKKTAKVTGAYLQEDLDRGFNTSGLWAYSRHPNFAAEQCVWVSMYLWSCYVTETYYNWTGIGAIAYLILFQASTWFTELITARKYPSYAEYQRRVGKFFPGLTNGKPGNFRDLRGVQTETNGMKKVN